MFSTGLMFTQRAGYNYSPNLTATRSYPVSLINLVVFLYALTLIQVSLKVIRYPNSTYSDSREQNDGGWLNRDGHR